MPRPRPDIKHKLIDTHCHLEMSAFNDDMDEVILRAFSGEGGLEAMVTIASDPASNEQAMGIASRHEHIYCSVGLHPHDARLLDETLRAKIETWSSAPKVVAIGETGLDYHYDHSPRDVQRAAFEFQLALAISRDLPLIVHSREADEDTMAILKGSGLRRGVLHCFNGSMRLLELAASLGMHVSVAGPVTFPKAAELRESVRHIPDELLLIETDAPYLTPAPYRGKRNEPAYVAYTAAELAALRGVTPEDIARITTVNARRLFGIGPQSSPETIAYQIRDSLYLNITNRCTNNCGFCVRGKSDFVKGHYLRLQHEPSVAEVKAAIGDPRAYREIVFCGYGEPTMRLDLLKDVASWVKGQGVWVRLNTNGQGSMINARDIVPELIGLVDELSVSLDAQDERTYNRICSPVRAGAYDAVKAFIRRASRALPVVKATVVDLEGVDVARCEAIAKELGAGFRLRRHDIVG